MKHISKIKGGIMFFFIITLSLLCCTSLHSSVGSLPIIKNAYKASPEYKVGVENFAFMIKTSDPIIKCTEDDKILFREMCEETLISTASGFVFSHDKESIFIMTAGHFCEPEKELIAEEKISGFVGDQYRELHYINHDLKLDVCILMGVKFTSESYNKIEFIDELPKIGEEIYTVAAPQGIAGEGIRPIFTGHFAGCDENVCMTTIQATFGSSGAGIFTKEGKLVSIVMAVSNGFDHVMITPSHEKLKNYIMKLDESVDIY